MTIITKRYRTKTRAKAAAKSFRKYGLRANIVGSSRRAVWVSQRRR